MYLSTCGKMISLTPFCSPSPNGSFILYFDSAFWRGGLINKEGFTLKVLPEGLMPLLDTHFGVLASLFEKEG
jgi:hypothetical protein